MNSLIFTTPTIKYWNYKRLNSRIPYLAFPNCLKSNKTGSIFPFNT